MNTWNDLTNKPTLRTNVSTILARVAELVAIVTDVIVVSLGRISARFLVVTRQSTELLMCLAIETSLSAWNVRRWFDVMQFAISISPNY